MYIYHILPKTEWYQVKSQSEYAPESLQNEKFIHCSKADQLSTVANSFFKGRKDLYVLKINEKKVLSKVVFEAPYESPQGQIHFPHIYGPLNLDSVEDAMEYLPDASGQFGFPDQLLD